MLQEILEMYFMAIRDNDSSTSDNWIVSTISASWDSWDANNDACLFTTPADNYPDIGCPLKVFNLVKWPRFGCFKGNFCQPRFFGTQQRGWWRSIESGPKTAVEAAKNFQNKQECIQLDGTTIIRRHSLRGWIGLSRKQSTISTRLCILCWFSVGGFVRVLEDLSIGILSCGGLQLFSVVCSKQFLYLRALQLRKSRRKSPLSSLTSIVFKKTNCSKARAVKPTVVLILL